VVSKKQKKENTMTTAKFGRNLRITVDAKHRTLVRRLFGEVLGCKLETPRDDLDRFLFDDGFSLGAFFVETSEALRPEDHKRAPWLEIAVDDIEKAVRELGHLGIYSFEYTDKAHPYFDPPSGPVFRLTARAA
jgi:hypothetical protein